jgi:hypothetical protein
MKILKLKSPGIYHSGMPDEQSVMFLSGPYNTVEDHIRWEMLN